MPSTHFPSPEHPDYSKIVEFGVWPTEDGWAGRHDSGREITADTFRRLEVLACAVRIAETYREAFGTGHGRAG